MAMEKARGLEKADLHAGIGNLLNMVMLLDPVILFVPAMLPREVKEHGNHQK
jgi:hypothetical protein